MDNKITVTAEFRPRIQNCHFYVNNIKEPMSVRILGTETLVIELENGDKLTLHCSDLKLTKNAPLNIQFEEGSVYFQVKTHPGTNYGSFSCEFLTDFPRMDFADIKPYTPGFETGTPYQMLCRNCHKTILPEDMSFVRILPLPDCNVEDFFCHKGSCSSVDLNPKVGDCLYNNYYFKIKYEMPSIRGRVVFCQRCDSWLGLKEGAIVTLWNSGVAVQEGDEATVDETALQDFTNLMKSILKKDIKKTTKVILNSQIDDKTIHHLLMWVMDKNLTLLVNEEIKGKDIWLKKINVIKVMYSYEVSITELVKSWRGDATVIEEEISQHMISSGLKALREMSQSIPEKFRKANQLNLSYIK